MTSLRPVVARLMHVPNRVALAACVLTAVGFALRLYRLDAQPIWWDEAYSIDLALRGFVEATLLTAGDIHPPLHYWLLAAWLPLVGTGEFAVRFHSLAFGVLLVPLVFQLARSLFGKPAGVASAGVAALAPFHVAYSQEARMYTLEVALSLASVWLMVRLLQRAARDEPLALSAGLYATVTALALWADYFPIFAIVAQNVFVLVWLGWWYWRDSFDPSASPRPYHLARLGPPAATPMGGTSGVGLPSLARRQALLTFPWWLGANLLAALLYAPWALVAWEQVTGYGVGRISTPPLDRLLLDLWAAYFAGQTVVPEAVLPWLVAATVGAVACAVALVARKPKPTSWLLTWLLVPVAVFLAILVVRPFFNERYAFVATPALIVLLGAGMVCPLPFGEVARGWWRILRRANLIVALPVAALAIIALAGHYFDPRFGRDDSRAVVAWLREATTADDVILLQTRHPFSYYADVTPREAATLHGARLLGVAAAVSYLDARPATTPRDLAEATAGKRRAIWVTWAHSDTDPWGMVRFLLSRAGTLEDDRRFTGFRAEVYALGPNPRFNSTASQPVDVRFGDALALEAVSLEGPGGATHGTSGEAVYVTLRWRGLAIMRDEYKFSVRLVDHQGHRVAQYDRLLWNDARRQTDLWAVGDVTLAFAPLPTPGLAPGEYSIEVAVYSETAGQLLPVGRAVPVTVGRITLAPAVRPPRVEALGLARGSQASSDGLRLLGLTAPRPAGRTDPPAIDVAQGEAIELVLGWQATAPRPAPPASLVFEAAGGRAAASVPLTPGGPDYPSRIWPSGAVVKQWLTLRVPPGLDPGSYTLTLRFGGAREEIETVRVRALPRSFALPRIASPLAIRFADGIDLAGWEPVGAEATAATVRAGSAATVRLVWRAHATPTTDYTVFVQLLAGDSRVVAQDDRQPAGGTAPTASWLAGQVIIDDHRLVVPSGVPPGEYRLIAGLYDARSGVRVRVENGGDYVELSRVHVRPE